MLLEFFSESKNCLKKLDDKLVELLEKSMGPIEEKMKTHEEQLKQKEYFLLVAGKWLLSAETGKSFVRPSTEKSEKVAKKRFQRSKGIMKKRPDRGVYRTIGHNKQKKKSPIYVVP